MVPEFDAPAHVGNGWQFAEKNHPEWGKLAVCVNKEEWQDYCVEPPCGQVRSYLSTILTYISHFNSYLNSHILLGRSGNLSGN